jgi:hypothetical protein
MTKQPTPWRAFKYSWPRSNAFKAKPSSDGVTSPSHTTSNLQRGKAKAKLPRITVRIIPHAEVLTKLLDRTPKLQGN